MKTVLGWVKSIFSAPVKIAQDVAKLASQAVGYVWSILTAEFNAVKSAWNVVLTGAAVVRDLIYDVAHNAYVFGRWLVNNALPDITKWAVRQLDKAANALEAAVSTLRRWVNGLIADVRDTLGKLPGWVMDHVYNPLLADFKQAWNWITKEGAKVLGYIEHPAALAALLLAPLWTQTLKLLKGSEAAIARWLLGGIYQAMIETAGIVEDIFTKLV